MTQPTTAHRLQPRKLRHGYRLRCPRQRTQDRSTGFSATRPRLGHSTSLQVPAEIYTSAGTVPPIGQHGVSIDHLGNFSCSMTASEASRPATLPLALTETIVPPGPTKSRRLPRRPRLPQHRHRTLKLHRRDGPNLFSPICGSVYDVAGKYLVDFATTNQAAAAATPASSASPVPGNIAIIDNYLLAPSNNQTSVIIVGVGSASSIQFISAIGSAAGPCTPGWNALPFSTNVFTF